MANTRKSKSFSEDRDKENIPSLYESDSESEMKINKMRAIRQQFCLFSPKSKFSRTGLSKNDYNKLDMYEEAVRYYQTNKENNVPDSHDVQVLWLKLIKYHEKILGSKQRSIFVPE